MNFLKNLGIKKTVIIVGSILLVICLIVALSLYSAGVQKKQYKNALEFIERGMYNKAYGMLVELGDYGDAKELLKDFTLLPTKVTQLYSSGEKSTAVYEYDPDGNVIKIVDPNVTTVYTYDKKGNLIKEVSTNSEEERITEYFYDENDNLIRRILNGNVLEYVYDDNGNLLQEINKGVVTICSCDSEGNVIKKVYKDGDYTTYSYDESGNVLKEVYINAQENKNTVKEYTYDKNGNLIAVNAVSKNEHGTVTSTEDYEYDEYNNVKRFSYGGSEGMSGYTEYEYELNFVVYNKK